MKFTYSLTLIHALTYVGAFTTTNFAKRPTSYSSRLFVGNFFNNIFGNTKKDSAGISSSNNISEEECDLCVIGGGVSGMASALAFMEEEGNEGKKVLLLEASSTLGGRVQSDITEDGYILDRGFAVFIEEYPFAKKVLDYADLKLSKFEPGALVYTGEKGTLFKVADPIRRPADIFVALTAPVGEFSDKLKVLPLLVHVFTSSVEELFAEPETDTLTCLKERWGFSDKFISQFMQPFLEGIYLADLEEQSSRMFHFVFKMFSEGSACLPRGGMNGVSFQMASKCKENGVEVRTDSAVLTIDTRDDSSVIRTKKGSISTKSVIVATEGNVAENILSNFSGVDVSETQVQRSVGCLYYTFDSKPPVSEPILILNGDTRDPKEAPVNNLCFPSVVAPSYAPGDSQICSVTILKSAMDIYANNMSELDVVVRNQISSWFPAEYTDDILNKWELKGTYDIKCAQPAQYGGVSPANVNGGRDCSTFRGADLPMGVFVCGDHVATATLNGALESGIKAGKAAAECLRG